MALALRTLDDIDPAEAWRPWRPSAGDPWNRKWAAHLYRPRCLRAQPRRSS